MNTDRGSPDAYTARENSASSVVFSDALVKSTNRAMAAGVGDFVVKLVFRFGGGGEKASDTADVDDEDGLKLRLRFCPCPLSPLSPAPVTKRVTM